jgi:hypothetical protein
VQIFEFLSNIGTKPGLTGSEFGPTGLNDAQPSLTDVHTGPSIPNNSNLFPRVDKSAIDDLKNNKADVNDWRKPIVDYLQDLGQKVDRKVW